MSGVHLSQRLPEALASLAMGWTLFTGVASLTLLGLWYSRQHRAIKRRLKAAQAADPSLLRKHTTYESYTTPSGYTYPRIRTFYKEHQQAAQLPKDLPLLVFTHGLGGSASQYAPLLTSLINLAPCLAIDLPGCGLSSFAPDDPKAYTTHALTELLYAAIERFRDVESNQKSVLFGHSMGCSINTLLTSTASPLAHLLNGQIVGNIAICPRGAALTDVETSGIQRLKWMPIFAFDVFRWYDRRGGINSRSVTRLVGGGADDETRKLQLKYNEQSQSAVFLRMVGAGLGATGLPGRKMWSAVKVPLFLIGGEADNITPAAEVEQITTWLTSQPSADAQRSANGTVKAPPIPATAGDAAKASSTKVEKPRTNSGNVIQDDDTSTKHAFALKTTIFPKPAGHGLLYSSSTVRILSGMIENFMSSHIDQRLAASWQMHTLTKSGKWDVKNLKKWQAVEPCSSPIGGIFRAMKTMREVDDEHCPKEFVKHYSCTAIPDGVAVVLDISHEAPVYHPKGLEDGGVEYYKFPTVSKEKPKPEEVEHFIELVDGFRDSPKLQSAAPGEQHPTIGVHCHYGFNRTGFFIVCYLVERMGYRLQDAIDEFALKRAPGLKHEHFINELYVRYAVKLERRNTVVGP